ncbi:MAG: helix-turn-helix transcriptional regulator [Bacteroidales bacterium]
MKNKRLEDRRRNIPKEVDLFVKHSFEIVDCIHEILEKQGKEQKDLAVALGKSESEISKWMSGTHNFTIKTIAKIETVLGESIIKCVPKKKNDILLYVTQSEITMPYTKKASEIPMVWEEPSFYITESKA